MSPTTAEKQEQCSGCEKPAKDCLQRNVARGGLTLKRRPACCVVCSMTDGKSHNEKEE